MKLLIINIWLRRCILTSFLLISSIVYDILIMIYYIIAGCFNICGRHELCDMDDKSLTHETDIRIKNISKQTENPRTSVNIEAFMMLIYLIYFII